MFSRQTGGRTPEERRTVTSDLYASWEARTAVTTSSKRTVRRAAGMFGRRLLWNVFVLVLIHRKILRKGFINIIVYLFLHF